MQPNVKYSIPPSMRVQAQARPDPLHSETERRLIRIETKLCRLMAHFGLNGSDSSSSSKSSRYGAYE